MKIALGKRKLTITSVDEDVKNWNTAGWTVKWFRQTARQCLKNLNTDFYNDLAILLLSIGLKDMNHMSSPNTCIFIETGFILDLIWKKTQMSIN
jgi:hypothetical protein